MTRDGALKILGTVEFRPFTKADWYLFSGCETQYPLICDTHQEYVIVMDGGSFTFYPLYSDEPDEWFRFEI